MEMRSISLSDVRKHENMKKNSADKRTGDEYNIMLIRTWDSVAFLHPGSKGKEEEQRASLSSRNGGVSCGSVRRTCFIINTVYSLEKQGNKKDKRRILTDRTSFIQWILCEVSRTIKIYIHIIYLFQSPMPPRRTSACNKLTFTRIIHVFSLMFFFFISFLITFFCIAINLFLCSLYVFITHANLLIAVSQCFVFLPLMKLL